jgi:hypothetical protein
MAAHITASYSALTPGVIPADLIALTQWVFVAV